MQQAIRRIVVTGATATVGATAVVGSTRTSETESLQAAEHTALPLSTADLQPTNRYVFEPEVETGDESDVVCVKKEDFNTPVSSIAGPNKSSTGFSAMYASGSDLSPALRYAPHELLQTVNKVSPTVVEVDAAIKSIADHPEVLNNCLPNFSSLDEPFRESIIGAVKGILTPDMIKSTQNNIRCAEMRLEQYDGLDDINYKKGDAGDDRESENCSRSTSSLSYGLGPYTAEMPDGFLFEDSSSGDAKAAPSFRVHSRCSIRNPVMQWEMLKDKYPCAICQDLLAAPSILNCSHSFCGTCLNDMVESCVFTAAEDDDELDELQQSCEIAYRCPQCKEEITSTTFERLLDSDIQRLVDAVPECEAKKHWKERRGQYLKSQISKRGQQKIGADGTRNRNSSERRRAQSRGYRTGGTAAEDDDEFWETVKEYAIPLLSFAVLALICVCRMK